MEPKSNMQKTATEWSAKSSELAAWTETYLVNRRDIYGVYTSDGSCFTAPRSDDRSRSERRDECKLTVGTLQDHYAGKSIIGTHAVSSDNTCRWVAWDIDAHGHVAEDNAVLVENLANAYKVLAKLKQLGLDPILSCSNGNGGYHIRVIFAEPIASDLAFRLGKWVVAALELDPRLESFPKQEAVTEERFCGSFLRLYGKHHTRDYWCDIWHRAEGRWLTGGEAVTYLLAHRGVSKERIPPEVAVWQDPARLGVEAARENHRVQLAKRRADDYLKPGDDFNDRCSKAELGRILTSEGWTDLGNDLYRRPGKTDGYSASISTGCLVCFSDSPETRLPWTPKAGGYSVFAPFAVLAYLKHGGDFIAAARDLASQGYGSHCRSFETEDEPTKLPVTGGTQRPAVFREIPPYKPFPVDLLPETVQRLAREGAKSIGCDPAMIGLPALVVMAGLIGRSRSLQVKKGWSAPAILWGAVIAASGSSKSPAQGLAISPVDEIAKELRTRNAELERAHERDVKEYKAAMKAWEKASSKVKEPPPLEPEAPRLTRLRIQDSSIEGVRNLLCDNPRGLLLPIEELQGWLKGFDQYKSGGGNEVAHWLQMHQGGQLQFDRVSKGNKGMLVPNAAVSIVGGIQPGVLSRVMTKDFRESGLMPRLLLTQPPVKPKQFSMHEVAEGTTKAWSSLCRGLWSLEPADDGEPKEISLSNEATSAYSHWFNELNNRAMPEHMRSVYSKLESAAVRIALILHVAERHGTNAEFQKMDAATIQRGCKLADWFGHEAERVYELMQETESQRTMRRVYDWIHKKGGSVTLSDLVHGMRDLCRTSDHAEKLLVPLLKSGKLRRTTHKPGGKGGRPKTTFDICG